jgi:hypothetical protein
MDAWPRVARSVGSLYYWRRLRYSASCVLPYLTKRCPLESFGFEHPLGRSEMFFGFTHTTTLRKRD